MNGPKQDRTRVLPLVTGAGVAAIAAVALWKGCSEGAEADLNTPAPTEPLSLKELSGPSRREELNPLPAPLPTPLISESAADQSQLSQSVAFDQVNILVVDTNNRPLKGVTVVGVPQSANTTIEDCFAYRTHWICRETDRSGGTSFVIDNAPSLSEERKEDFVPGTFIFQAFSPTHFQSEAVSALIEAKGKEHSVTITLQPFIPLSVTITDLNTGDLLPGVKFALSSSLPFCVLPDSAISLRGSSDEQGVFKPYDGQQIVGVTPGKLWISVAQKDGYLTCSDTFQPGPDYSGARGDRVPLDIKLVPLTRSIKVEAHYVDSAGNSIHAVEIEVSRRYTSANPSINPLSPNGQIEQARYFQALLSDQREQPPVPYMLPDSKFDDLIEQISFVLLTSSGGLDAEIENNRFKRVTYKGADLKALLSNVEYGAPVVIDFELNK